MANPLHAGNRFIGASHESGVTSPPANCKQMLLYVKFQHQQVAKMTPAFLPASPCALKRAYRNIHAPFEAKMAGEARQYCGEASHRCQKALSAHEQRTPRYGEFFQAFSACLRACASSRSCAIETLAVVYGLAGGAPGAVDGSGAGAGNAGAGAWGTTTPGPSWISSTCVTPVMK